MVGRILVSAAVGRATNALSGGYRGPRSHAMGAGSNAARGVPTSSHSPLSNVYAPSPYSSTRLQFPFNVESDPHQGHYIVFDIKKYKPANLDGLRAKQKTLEKGIQNMTRELRLGGPAVIDNDLTLRALERASMRNLAKIKGAGGGDNFSEESKANSAISLRNKQTRSSKASIALYMPPSVTTGYKVNYGNPEIALHTEVGLKAFEAFMADQGGFWSGLQASVDAAKGGIKEMARRGSLATVDKVFPGARVISQMRTGLVITPRMELMFESVGRRSFTYTFIFIPKSLREAEEVEKIVYQFKHAMHPKFLSGGNNIRTMEIPDTFEITYMNNNGQNAFLNKISSCFLQSMDVQYGADRFTAYPEAKHTGGATGSPPQKTQISLNFSELAILTQQDVEEGY